MKPLLMAALLSLLPLPGAARAPADALRQMLDLVPALPVGEMVQVEFGDLSAARAQPAGTVPGATADPALTQLRALERSALSRAIRDPATDWRGAVGFGPAQIDQVVTLTAPPVSAALIRLQPGTGAGVPTALAARGYALTDGPGLTAWARGDMDFSVDIAARDPDDPFGGGMGRSSRIVVADDLVLQAAGWPVLAALLAAPGGSMAAQSDIAALLAALDRTTGAGALISALILTDAGGLGLGDPAAMLRGAPPSVAGAPTAWRMALLADFANGAQATGVLALTVTLPDAATAQALREHVQAGWDTRALPGSAQGLGAMLGVPAQVSVTDAGGELWVLLVQARAPAVTIGPGIPRNPVSTLLHDAMMRRELVILQP